MVLPAAGRELFICADPKTFKLCLNRRPYFHVPEKIKIFPSEASIFKIIGDVTLLNKNHCITQQQQEQIKQ